MSPREGAPAVAVETRDTSKSELSAEEKRILEAYTPDAVTMQRAREMVDSACSEVGVPQPEDSVYLQAAKIIGALGERRLPRDIAGQPHKVWLLTEGVILDGKDPAYINEASLSFLLGGGVPQSEGTAPVLETRKSDLGPLNEYVDRIIESGAGALGGYSTNPPQDCNFSLKNGKGADLLVSAGPGAEQGTIDLVFRSKAYSVVKKVRVSSPDEAAQLIKDWSETP